MKNIISYKDYLMKEAWMTPVLKFDMNGVYIDRYECINDAAKDNNINRTDITNMLSKRRKSAGGFLWAYEYDYNPNQIKDLKDKKTNFFNSPRIHEISDDEISKKNSLWNTLVSDYQKSKNIKEHKLWGKTIPEFLNWIDSKSNRYLVILDTETTGLRSDPYEVQLTQVSCIVVKYNFSTNTFNEVGKFNKKIELTQKTTELMKDVSHRIHKILQFNHYDEGEGEFHSEQNVLQDLFEYIEQFNDPILVIQNAEFDMKFLNTRHPIVRFDNEVIDTKQILQLFYLPTIQKLAETDDNYKQLISKIGTSDRDNGLISSSMGKIGPALGMNMTGYHDALTDCRLSMEMFKRIIEFLKENQNVDIKKYQAERIKTK